MFPKNSGNLLKFAISKCTHHFKPFGINAAHFPGSSSRIFDNIVAKWTFRIQQFLHPKSITKVAITKTESAKSIVFFSFPPFVLLTSFFLFLFYCDFGSSQAKEICLLMPFHSNDCKFC